MNELLLVVTHKIKGMHPWYQFFPIFSV